MEKKPKTVPYPMRLSLEELEQLEELQALMGLANRTQVVKRLIATAHVRPGSIKFAQPETAQQN
jgi:hypothetical protein